MAVGKTITQRCKGVAPVIITACCISKPQRSGSQRLPQHIERLTAMWDTGATTSSISPKVATFLGLETTGIAEVTMAHGTAALLMHIVDLELPNGVCFRSLTVLQSDLTPEDVLIGMDIISQGDFAYSTAGGNTTFSFCCPAAHPIDFALM